jgi:DNA-binding IclR family transcriptional regulator
LGSELTLSCQSVATACMKLGSLFALELAASRRWKSHSFVGRSLCIDILCMNRYTSRQKFDFSGEIEWRQQSEVSVDYHAPTVALAIQVLRLLSREKYKHSALTELAGKLNASPTTCLRILRTLERDHLVCFDAETKRYSLGPYLITLGNRAAQMNDIIARANAAIKRIAIQTGLTTALLQRWDDRLIFLSAAEPPPEDARFTRLSIPVGHPTYLIAGAHGRCFLAYDTEDEWRRLAAQGLQRLTPDTIVDPDELFDALRKVRRDGYAISHGEFHAGTTAIDAPVFGQNGRVELAISCMYVTSQIERDRADQIGRLLRVTARKLSNWDAFSIPVAEAISVEVVEA